MGLGVRFDPGVVEAPVGVLGDLLDELVSALAKSAKGGEGDRLEVDVWQSGTRARPEYNNNDNRQIHRESCQSSTGTHR